MEFLVFILGIACLVWGGVLLMRGGLMAACLAVLLAGACFGVEFFKISIGPAPLTLDRLLFVMLVVQYFLWRRNGWTDSKPLGKPEIVLLAFMVAMIFSTFSADYSSSNYQPVAWLIIYYLMPCGLYWIARQIDYKKGPESHTSEAGKSEISMPVLGLFISLVVFGVYLALTAVAEHYEINSVIFPRYIVQSASSADAEFVGRARGPFLTPISNGIALSICFAASLMLWPWLARATDSAADVLRTRIRRLMLVPLYLLVLAAIYFTLTRSCWMSGALALAVVVGLALPWSWRMPILVGGLIITVAFSVARWDDLMAFKRDKNLDAGKVAESVELRPVLARIAWNMFLDRPLFGCGYAQYTNEHVNYLADRSTDLPLEKGRAYIQHNVFFSLLTETGLLGLGLFLALCAFWARDAWRLWRSESAPLAARQMGLLMLATLGVYFINGCFHDVSVTPMANMVLFFLAGVTAGLRPGIIQTNIPNAGAASGNRLPRRGRGS
jgi:O-antigen ligase